MKAVYMFIVVVACVTVSMASRKRNSFENTSEKMFKSEDVSKREECEDKWHTYFCKLVKRLGRCDSSRSKEKCAETCGQCNRCGDIFSLPKCLHLKETNRCYTDEARANCGTTCESCGKACKNYVKQCDNQKTLDELCTIKSGGFLLCPRGCNLCIDRE
ncbi:uncharacterized protein ZK643.6-like [Actinia tenebrosa]|uniref:Uncharacterized protein ZK643.6-like n=1 Tax=Actinia tenebrosa TaxID=6105 RepID=A0A6P8I9R6_ACTTE|nr:uncharacterized protein ZK643.6-like [Actinia tenebrosa]